MATLHITRLECVKKSDVDRDEVEIWRVDGTDKVISGPHTMSKGQELTLSNLTQEFVNSIDLRLMEVDGESGGSNDDVLGNATMVAREAGTGSHIKTFRAQAGADYHLHYFVS